MTRIALVLGLAAGIGAALWAIGRAYTLGFRDAEIETRHDVYAELGIEA